MVYQCIYFPINMMVGNLQNQIWYIFTSSYISWRLRYFGGLFIFYHSTTEFKSPKRWILCTSLECASIRTNFKARNFNNYWNSNPRQQKFKSSYDHESIRYLQPLQWSKPPVKCHINRLNTQIYLQPQYQFLGSFGKQHFVGRILEQPNLSKHIWSTQ